MPSSAAISSSSKRQRQAGGSAGARASTIRNAVVSLQRGLEILRTFQPEDGPLSRHEIAQRTGLPNTTVTRLIHTLLTLGYLSRVGAPRGYRPGPPVLAIGLSLIEALPFRRIARPLMQQFAMQFNAWVTLATAERNTMLILEHAAPPQAADIQVRSGSLLPMASTALGRAYLWALAPDYRAQTLREIEQGARTGKKNFRHSLGTAFAELDRDGFCTAFGTWRRDVLGVGTPIALGDGSHALALACGNTNLAINARILVEKHGPALLRTATEIKNGLLQSGFQEDL